MRINNNLMAMNTHRQLGVVSNSGAKATEKLSSGFRINRAGDDAAGLAISEKMRGQIRGLTQASRNAQDGISLIQTAEGALNETHAILQRMRELAVQSATDTNTKEDRAEIQKEIDQLLEEIDRIADNTEFNTQKLINGDLAGVAAPDGGEEETKEAKAVGEKITVLDFSSDSKTFKINEKNITLSDEYNDIEELIEALETQLGDDSGVTVSKNEDGDGIILTSDEDIELEGDVDAIGLTAGTVEAKVVEGNEEGSGDDDDPATEEAKGAVIHIGANQGQNVTINIASMKTNALGGGVAAPDGGEEETKEAKAVGEKITVLDFSSDSKTFKINEKNITLSDEYNDIEELIEALETQLGDDSGVTVSKNEDGDGIILTSDEDIELEGDVDAIGLTAGTVEAKVVEGNEEGSGDDNGPTAGGVTIASLKGDGLLTRKGADAAITNINTAITQVSAERSKLGALQNRLEHTIKNLDNSAENLQAAESRIRDVDMAQEMMEFTKQNILQQASTAMLAQANMAPQTVLQLLR